MALRKLTNVELHRIKRLTEKSINLTLIQPTSTGLRKSILDATFPVRNFLKENKLHNYCLQKQGAKDYGVKIKTTIFTENLAISSQASLYRPNTKNGDPRMWFTELSRYADSDDIIAIMTYEEQLILVNITKIDIDYVLDVQNKGPLWEIIQIMMLAAQSVAQELLIILKKIAQNGPLRSVMDMQADTAIGRTVEKALGISMNSRQEPDYKGIELKSFRRSKSAARENRKTLFAKVPNWKMSKFKSSKQILDCFGYTRRDDFKLYCTVSTTSSNSQGLFFNINNKEGLLNECSTKEEIGVFASWILQDLRSTLMNKHNETFWISADVQQKDGHDYFKLKDILHTSKPILSQFDILLEQGEITMDHLIKRNSSGRVSEKGPLFKIASASLPLLFPPSQFYKLS